MLKLLLNFADFQLNVSIIQPFCSIYTGRVSMLVSLARAHVSSAATRHTQWRGRHRSLIRTLWVWGLASCSFAGGSLCAQAGLWIPLSQPQLLLSVGFQRNRKPGKVPLTKTFSSQVGEKLHSNMLPDMPEAWECDFISFTALSLPQQVQSCPTLLT